MRYALLLIFADCSQHFLIIIRNDLLEIRNRTAKVLQNLRRKLRSRLFYIIAQNLLQLRNVLLIRHFLKRIHILVHPAVQRVITIENICDSA